MNHVILVFVSGFQSKLWVFKGQPQVCLEIAVFILTFPPGGRFGKRKFDYFLVDKHVDKVHE